MRKTLASVAVLSTLAVPSLAMAQAAAAPASPHTFSPNVGVVSNYLFRGVSQTRGKAALQGGIDYSHSSGLYAGIWGSTITWVKDWLGSGSTEIDVYGGYKNSFGSSDWSYDVGLIKYTYPGSGAQTRGNAAVFAQLADPATTEVYGAISYKIVTLKYSRAVSSHFIGWVPTTAAGVDLTKNSKGSDYLELNLAHDFGNTWGLTAHIGSQKVKNVVRVVGTPNIEDANYTDWNIGVTKDAGYGVFGLTYSDTDAKGSCSSPFPATGNASAYCWGTNMNSTTGGQSNFKNVAKGTVVLSFKKTF